ncbi:MAG: NAD(P)/FAD-dependent oxidoreductase [Alphaproteobacteria bacterium]|nr:NAD(P)/FAD-dependent oxidoreductase [Alphaproteobacteria bacterium]
MVERVECVVVGAGVVGLAVARALALAGRDVVILEAADAIGTEISSRNSEVIHAGIYYPTGSLKARLCVSGKQALYRYCGERGIPHRRCTKLIVATDDQQVATLARLKAQAAANGVDDLELLDGAAARAIEPQLACVAALLSPSTGIVDSHGLMLAYLGEAEAHGAMLALESPLLSAKVMRGGFVLEVGGREPTVLACDLLVNSAGLEAPGLARRIAGLDPSRVPQGYYAKGNYFALSGRSPFGCLIYPVPEQAGLGVHLTIDLGGQARFGPDVEWVERIDYDVDPHRADAFYSEIRRYWPALPDGALKPAYAGIRPKISAKGQPAADYLIQGPADHGIPGLVNLLGIESPGLTASLAIGEYVGALLDTR